MNLVDLLIFVLLGLFVLMGMYSGFIRSCLNVCSFILSFGISMLVYPLISKAVYLNDKLVNSFRFYAEGTEKLMNLENGALEVATLSREQINQIVNDSVSKVSGGLKPPLDKMVQKNMINHSFNGRLSTVGEYFNETIVHYGINILCFILVFFIVKMVLNLILDIYDNTRVIPRLKQYDVLVGGLVGFVEGLLIFFVIFSIIPLIYNIMEIKPIEELLNSSMMGNVFINGNIIPRIIRSIV